MLTKAQIYQTLNYKDWKCTHEVKEKLDTESTTYLETSLFTEFVQNQSEVILSTIEKYLTAFVDEKVAEARKRVAQSNQQIELCGLQKEELEYRLLPQEIKLRSGTEKGRPGEYRSVE